MFLLVVSGKIAHTSGQTHDLRWITESTAESNKWEHNIKPSCNWTYVHSTEAMVNFEMEPYCRSKTDFWWRNHKMKPLVAIVWWSFIVLCNMYAQSVHSACVCCRGTLQNESYPDAVMASGGFPLDFLACWNFLGHIFVAKRLAGKSNHAAGIV